MRKTKLQKIIFIFIVAAFLAPNLFLASANAASAAVRNTAAVEKKPALNDLVGRFAIQKQSYDRLWYVAQDKYRYYLQNDEDLKWLIKKFSIRLAPQDLAKISRTDGKRSNAWMIKRFSGKLIRANDGHLAWYINPNDKRRYAIDGFAGLYALAKDISPKIDNATLRRAAMNKEQITFDAAYGETAYVKYDGSGFASGANDSDILPVASLTKLMTAMVLLDQNLDFDKDVVITAEEINYPGTLAEPGSTSEVPLMAGDKIKIRDLWISMLNASSNQSAVILADNSGLTRQQFAAAMNKKARDLGLKYTVFREMSGLDPNNISTAREFSILANAAFSDQRIIDATSHLEYSFWVLEPDDGLREVKVKNRNYSLLAFSPQASKTGYLIEAQRNVALKKDGEIIVVLHALSMKQRNDIIKKLLYDNKVTFAQ